MDNQTPGHSSSSQDRPPTETTRSRWTPKPEQILILESIFNSGMVNPPKDETVRIRKLLEKFGAVGDANVFYWFQNRRSRSRRRQRQMQAGLTASDPRVAPAAAAHAHHPGGVLLYEPTSSGSSSSNSSGNCFFPSCSASSSSSSSFLGDDSADDLFSISGQLGFMDNSQTAPWDVSQLHYQSGTITAFINGIPSDFPRGPIDMRATFGHDATLVHSSGELLPVNEYGVLMQSLQMGESYFLVSLRFQGQVSLRPSCINKDEDMCLVDLKWDP